MTEKTVKDEMFSQKSQYYKVIIFLRFIGSSTKI